MKKVFLTYDDRPQLLNGLIEKDPLAINKLCSMYQSILYGVISRIIKDEEASHEVLCKAQMRIWQNIDLYDPAAESLFLWMFRIVRKFAVHELRTKMNCPDGYLYIKTDNSECTDILNPFLYEIYASVYYFDNDIDSIAAHFNITSLEVMKLFRIAVNELRKHFNAKLDYLSQLKNQPP